jgi:lipoic acid synthetase
LKDKRTDRDPASPLPKPPWLKVRLGGGAEYTRLRNLVKNQCLHTVCEEALCPNMGRCWEKGRATILILGDTCSRSCRFCNVASRTPSAPDRDEPRRVAEAVEAMGLHDIVLTSVTRDDLADGGAAIWAETIRRIKEKMPRLLVEVLIPDFGGSEASLDAVIAAGPDVLGHNLETVRRLYPKVRPQADYDQSLTVLRRAHERGMITKTGIMAGVGETKAEVLDLIRDVRACGCDVFYAGQYLQPSRNHLAVERYVTPEEFELYRAAALEVGIPVCVSAPLVRSSYHSEEQEGYLDIKTGFSGSRCKGSCGSGGVME